MLHFYYRNAQVIIHSLQIVSLCKLVHLIFHFPIFLHIWAWVSSINKNVHYNLFHKSLKIMIV